MLGSAEKCVKKSTFNFLNPVCVFFDTVTKKENSTCFFIPILYRFEYWL
jgi:hypothetical protein